MWKNKLLLITFLIFVVIVPIGHMFLNSSINELKLLMSSKQFTTAILNSLISGITATVISILLAFIFSIIILKSGIKLKSVFSGMVKIPMMIPSISHGIGLIILFGNSGIITQVLNIKMSIYGFKGIVIGAVLYTLPIAVIMISDLLNYEDKSSYEAADILGVPKWRQFLDISLPYFRKPVISITFAVFSIIVTDYGVPLMLGGQYITLPVMMYQETIGLLNFKKGSIIGIILLFPAVITFVFDVITKESKSLIYVIKRSEIKKNKYIDIAAYIYCIGLSFLLILPIVAFVLLAFVKHYPTNMGFTFVNVLKSFEMGVGKYAVNSLIISVITSIVGTAVAYLSAYLTARSEGMLSKMLHFMSLLSMAIPGLVLGIAYVFCFKESIIYGSFAIIILVNLVHFFSSPYLIAYNSFNKITLNLEAVASTLKISKIKLIKDILIPQTYSTIIEMFIYFFVNSMITISAISFVSSYANRSIALAIPTFEAQMLMECSAVVSLMILGINLIMKWIISYIRKVYII
jgi:ABC-type Fe3+ transport system, permease component